jgi:hypothetical protein
MLLQEAEQQAAQAAQAAPHASVVTQIIYVLGLAVINGGFNVLITALGVLVGYKLGKRSDKKNEAAEKEFQQFREWKRANRQAETDKQ